MHERVTNEVKAFVLRRAGDCCEYCWCRGDYSSDPLSVEHIIPQSRGGSHLPDNLAASCLGCNNSKFTATEATDPVTGNTVPLYDPRHDDWHEHFRWDEDCTVILGVSPTGRATERRLRLNRPGVVNLRKVLRDIDRHPPRGFYDSTGG